MKPSQLKAFVTIAETGSLASAAALLHRTQPAISKTLRELEESLGLQLFNRSISGMTLTEAGNTLLLRARIVLEELRRGEQDMATLRGIAGGRIRIGMSPMAALLITRAIVRFRRQMPMVDIELHDHATGTLHDLLNAGKLDLAFSALPSFATLPSGVESNRLKAEPLSLAAPRSGAYSTATSLEDLREATWVYVDSTGAHREYVAGLYRAAGLEPPSHSLLCTSPIIILMLAAEFDVVLLLTQELLDIYREQLIALPLIAPPPYLELYSLQRAGTVQTRTMATFLECVNDTLSEPIPIYPHTRLLLGH
ncbi:LysR family transcriptional regulator [Burkholderia ubonensis]|uniref:LysR family transcriptional regulator n=1 Tax=Burkholderia ubonensis TaxID=101571 RepID=UPI0009B47BD2|nr:LysR family transcriptional regulator [Burkholderia ubonensis]